MLLQDVENIVKSHGGEAFKPCAFVDGLGSLTIVNEDCSQTHEPIPETNIEVIRNIHTGKVVGVKIHRWDQYKKDSL